MKKIESTRGKLTHPKKRKWKESKTVPGQGYELGDLVRRFQAGGVISQDLARPGEYTGNNIPPEASTEMIDLVDYQRFADTVAEREKADKAREKAEAKAKALAEQEAQFKKWADEKGYTINDATIKTKNDDATK
jgi:hypothetical protein